MGAFKDDECATGRTIRFVDLCLLRIECAQPHQGSTDVGVVGPEASFQTPDLLRRDERRFGKFALLAKAFDLLCRAVDRLILRLHAMEAARNEHDRGYDQRRSAVASYPQTRRRLKHGYHLPEAATIRCEQRCLLCSWVEH